MCQFRIMKYENLLLLQRSKEAVHNWSTHPVWYELPLLDSDCPDIRQGEGVGPLVGWPHQVAEEPQIGSLVHLNIIFTNCEKWALKITHQNDVLVAIACVSSWVHSLDCMSVIAACVAGQDSEESETNDENVCKLLHFVPNSAAILTFHWSAEPGVVDKEGQHCCSRVQDQCTQGFSPLACPLKQIVV